MGNHGSDIRSCRVFEFFVSGVGASVAMRIKVLQPAPDRCFHSEERRRAGVWSRSSGISLGVIRVFLRRWRSMVGMTSQHIGVLKFRLRPMKLIQVRLRRGTCVSGVSHLRLAGARIISCPFFWSTSKTSRLLLLQASGFFQAFFDTSFATPEAQRRHQALLTARRRGKMMLKSSRTYVLFLLLVRMFL